VRKNRPKPYRVRWVVGPRQHSKSYPAKAQADGRRSELMSALRRGEQFDEDSGLPVSEIRAARKSVTWYEHTRDFVDRKWDAAPAKSRKNYADALATITPAMVKSRAGAPSTALLRRALYSWAYNRNRWTSQPPSDVAAALTWVERNSISVTELEEDKDMLRRALDALALKLNGQPAAPKTATRKRACLSDVLNMAVEKGYFDTPVSPLASIRWKAPKSVEEVDPESVANPRQVRNLLRGVRLQGARGEHLEAFFGRLSYAATRPAEASALQRTQCHLPESGWGELTLRGGVVRAGRGWTNGGRAHEDRQLKARAVRDSRVVPIPPVYVRMLRQHIAVYGTAPDGRLFRTTRNGLLQESGYGEVWARARAAALSEEEHASRLAERPYDLRHAGVSFWLSSGVDPVEVARRAGHSVAVLLRVYAKILSKAKERSNRLIDAALEQWNEPG
jgi:hypothetical protein